MILFSQRLYGIGCLLVVAVCVWLVAALAVVLLLPTAFTDVQYCLNNARAI